MALSGARRLSLNVSATILPLSLFGDLLSSQKSKGASYCAFSQDIDSIY
ncbi:MAG: hypothetical protein HC890_10860 [Chloroflexaceae bacterium]|nr:hypothetical protein [Chloroflexaceae bacterium]